jgi:hypothetical protein
MKKASEADSREEKKNSHGVLTVTFLHFERGKKVKRAKQLLMLPLVSAARGEVELAPTLAVGFGERTSVYFEYGRKFKQQQQQQQKKKVSIN